MILGIEKRVPSYPRLTVSESVLMSNIKFMAEWCRGHGVLLAPHIKTTMCRQIVERQVAAGAIAVTVATVSQAETAIAWGQRNVLLANEVVDQRGLTRLRELLENDPGVSIRCFIDSEYGVSAALRVFAGARSKLEVLVDVGRAGGRTGARDHAEAVRIAELVERSPGLRLVGIAGFEGIVANVRESANVASVDEHCLRAREIFIRTAKSFETNEPIFSMGGSAFPDRVLKFLPTTSEVPGVLRVLRSGCYVTHDHGTYAGVSELEGLVPALVIEAVVVSAPEAGFVVLGAGRRDLPYDAGYPILLSAAGPSGEYRANVTGSMTSIFDHHAVLTDAAGLAVGDVVRLGISHPCSAFDRWSELSVIDSAGRSTACWKTEFGRTG